MKKTLQAAGVFILSAFGFPLLVFYAASAYAQAQRTDLLRLPNIQLVETSQDFALDGGCNFHATAIASYDAGFSRSIESAPHTFTGNACDAIREKGMRAIGQVIGLGDGGNP